MEQTEQTPLERLNERLAQNSQSLHISRVPVRIKREFTDWANAEFCGDYGLALKALWEGKLDVATVMAAFGELQSRMSALESAPKTEQPKPRRMVGGNILVPRS